ncbi:MAG: sugar ABC transporter substrate-binding protein [Clostridiales bacterium]|nr:MAG: sugar ABC transporter substrate-binding protein [Clostridiales bacterium]
MKLKKWLATLLAGLMVLSFTSACGPSGGPSDSGKESDSSKSGSTDTEETKTITFWHSFTQPDREAAIAKVCKEFEAKHPGVKVDIEIYPWATFHTKWTTGLATKALPDISTALVDEAIMMAKSDATVPVDDVIDQIGRDRFVQKPLKILSYDDKNYAIPFYTHCRVLLYRKDVFAEKNIEPPETWQELIAASKAVTDPSKNQYGLVIPMSKSDYIATSFLYIISESLGAHLVKSDGTVDLTSPKMQESINILLDLYKAGSPEGSINYASKEENDMFFQGKSTIDINTGFNITGVRDSAPQYYDQIGIVPTPVENKGDPRNSGFADYISLVVWKNAKYPELTKELLMDLYQDDNYIDFLHCTPGGMLPALTDIAESEKYLDNEVIQKFKKEIDIIQEGVAVGAPIGGDMAASPSINIIKNQGLIESMLQKIILEGTPVDQAAKETEAKINQEIAQLK